MTAPWLTVARGEAPLVVSIPHTGTDLAGLENLFSSEWLARRDTDWWIYMRYDFAAALGATSVATALPRSVIHDRAYPPRTSLCPDPPTP